MLEGIFHINNFVKSEKMFIFAKVLKKKNNASKFFTTPL